jgi:arylsulfatase A-like enzyme
MGPAKSSRRDFLKTVGYGSAAISLQGCVSTARTSIFECANTKPNIVFILADDLGWSELGCYGNDFNETPNLDRLAAEGRRFTDAYAAAPVCSPYRAALLTGQYPARVGIVDYLRPKDKALSTDHLTIAKILKRNGYATGMIGKWHLTGYRYHGADIEIRAKDHGFDEELVSEIKGVGNGANFYPYKFR